MLAETLTEQNKMTQCITLMENMSPLQTSQSIVLQKKSVLGNEGLRRMECWELGSGRRVGDRSEGKGRAMKEWKNNKRKKTKTLMRNIRGTALAVSHACSPLVNLC